MTHVAWVPVRWQDAALEALAGLAERHPSRGILLFPHPEDERDELDAEVDLRCFRNPAGPGAVCSEVITIRLNGRRADAPASVVLPLLVADLPVFLRWRGDLELGAPPVQQLLGVVDRLVLDSGEWSRAAETFGRLPEIFDRVTVSDIAWARTLPWRYALATLWPGIAEASTLRVAGPEADAVLLAGWLGGRLGRAVELEREPAGELELVEVDGIPAAPGRLEPRSASELLSEQLDLFGRDVLYEEAVRSFSSVRV
jgi:glucose-6-phosphate dehydrogenase assembly protein OpcA